MDHYLDQVGGVKCSLCGSDGTNKSTCPLNKDGIPNPSKHPNAIKMISTTVNSPVTPAEIHTEVAVELANSDSAVTESTKTTAVEAASAKTTTTLSPTVIKIKTLPKLKIPSRTPVVKNIKNVETSTITPITPTVTVPSTTTKPTTTSTTTKPTVTSVVSVKVASIRPKYQDLREWMKDPQNVYIARRGIVLLEDPITGKKARFPPQDSKFCNPFPVKDYTLEKSLELYRAHLEKQISTGAITKEELRALKGKTLGCWCKPGLCHGDILLEFINK